MPNKLYGIQLRELVAAVAGPVRGSDNRKSWLARSARIAGISYRQARALYYGEIVDVNHRSARLMRDAVQQKACDLAGRFEQIAEAIRATDSEFFVEDAAALIHVARRLRGEDQP